MYQAKRVVEIYREQGFKSLLQSTGRYTHQCAEELAAQTLPSEIYWHIAPAYHRHRERRDVCHYDVPNDPFRILWVDPARIVYQTHRQEYPPWGPNDQRRWNLFGRVKGGDWDIPDEDFSRPTRVRDRSDFRAFHEHFVEGIPWEDIEYVNRKIRDGSSKLGSTRDEILESLAEYERLYETIRDNGYRTQRELAESGVEPKRFESAMGDEIAIDISRFGEPLFVDGSHRIAIAKILGLDEIPVVCYYRHEKWMERRMRAYRDCETVHFDFAEWS